MTCNIRVIVHNLVYFITEIRLISKSVGKPFFYFCKIEFLILDSSCNLLILSLNFFLGKFIGVKFTLHVFQGILNSGLFAIEFNLCIENGFEISYRFSEYANSVEQPCIDILKDGLSYNDVIYIYFGRLLAKTVDTSDTLFYYHRIPRQVIVN